MDHISREIAKKHADKEDVEEALEETLETIKESDFSIVLGMKKLDDGTSCRTQSFGYVGPIDVLISIFRVNNALARLLEQTGVSKNKDHAINMICKLLYSFDSEEEALEDMVEFLDESGD